MERSLSHIFGMHETKQKPFQHKYPFFDKFGVFGGYYCPKNIRNVHNIVHILASRRGEQQRAIFNCESLD